MYDDPGCSPEPTPLLGVGGYNHQYQSSSSCPTLLPYESISSRFLLEDDEETVVVDNLDKRPSIMAKQEKIQRVLHHVSQEERDKRDLQLIQLYTKGGGGGGISAGAGAGAGGKKPRPTNITTTGPPLRGRPSKPKSWSVSTSTTTTTTTSGGGAAAASSVRPALLRRQSLNLYPGYDLVVSDLDTILDTM